MRLLACTVMVFCSLALVRSFPLEDKSSSVIQNVETNQNTQEKELIRDKRTIGFLRDLFPNFSQIIDKKIQMLTRIIFRLVGRLVLRNNRDGGEGGETGVSVVLPTYPPSEDDEDEDEDEDSTPSGSDSDSAASQPATTTETSQSDDENKVEESKERKKRQAIENDKEEVGLADNNEVSEESGLEDDDKRYLNFNAAGSGTANSAGSGNFLFDVIRLVAGSGNNEETDEAANTPLEGAGSENHETSKGYDGLGVPGPLTRLFVIANRGVASLIQDLILRLAQTSEKLVSFKARLITSII